MFEIVSYGGGGFLADVLNGVAMLFGSSDYVHALKMCATMAAMGILIQSAFSGRLPDMKWIIVMVSIYMFAMVPKVDVVVTDTVKRAPGFPMSVPSQTVVADVPIGLAFTASITSGFKDYMVRGFETVFSLPTEVSFRKGGPLFAQGLVEKTMGATPKDPNLILSLQNFWRNCVFYDVALGFYSMSDLSAATNLQDFLGTNTAAGRGYEHIYKNGTKTILMCRQSIASGGSLRADIAADLSPIQGDITWSNSWLSFARSATGAAPSSSTTILTSGAASMPIAFQYMTGMSMSSSSILAQNVLANSFATHGLTAFSKAGEAEGMMQDYAATKAEAERNISFSVMGKIAAKMLPLLNIIAEATIYAVFPIIGLMLMFPAAGKVATAYLVALLWVALWAPLYALFHYFSMWFYAAGVSSAAQVCDAAMACAPQLNLYTMSGLKEAMSNAAAISGYLGTMVPMIAYMVVSKSGAMMAGSIGRVMDGYSQPVSSAAGEAAAGNIQMGSMAYQNISAFQQNTAPSQTSGFTKNDSGREVTHGTSTGEVSQMRVDSGPASINAQSGVQATVSSQLSDATKATQTASASMSEANANRLNTLLTAESSVGHGTGIGTTKGVDDKTSESQTLANVSGAIQSFAKTNGVNAAYMTASLASAGFNGGVAGKLLESTIGAKGEISADARNSEEYKKAEEFSKKFQTSQDFKNALDKSHSAYMQNTATDRSEASVTGREAVSNAAERSVTAQDNLTASLSREKALTAVAQDVQSNGVTGGADLSGYLRDRVKADGGNWSEFQLGVNRGVPGAMQKLDGYVTDYANDYVDKAVKAQSTDIEAQANSDMGVVRGSATTAVARATSSGVGAVKTEQRKDGTTEGDGRVVVANANVREAESDATRGHQGSTGAVYGAQVQGAAAASTSEGDDGKNHIERRVDQLSETTVAGRVFDKAAEGVAVVADAGADAVNGVVQGTTGVNLYAVGQDIGLAGRPTDPGKGLYGDNQPIGKPSVHDNAGDNSSGTKD